VRRFEVGDQPGGGREHADQHRKADAEHQPVCAHTGIWVYGTDRPDGRERGEGDGDCDGEERPGDDRPGEADEAVEARRRRVGPDRPQHEQVLVTSAQLAGDGLDREEKRCQAGDAAEDTESERLGFDRLRCFGFQLGSDEKVCEVVLGRGELALHRRDETGPSLHLDPVVGDRDVPEHQAR